MAAHVFEPGLMAAPPRRVRRRGGAPGWCLLLVELKLLAPFAAVAAGSAAAFVFLSAVLLTRQFAEAEAPGRVVAKSPGGPDRPTYRAEVEFGHWGGVTTAAPRLTRERHDRLVVGAGVAVRYTPWLPPFAPAVAGGPDPLPLLKVAWGVAGLLGLALSGAARGCFELTWGGRQLLRSGAAVAATVTGVERFWFRRKSGATARVRYEYRAPGPAGGRTYSGGYDHRPNTEAPAVTDWEWLAALDRWCRDPGTPEVAVGDTLTVLVDPRRPRRHVVYRLADYKVVPAQFGGRQ